MAEGRLSQALRRSLGALELECPAAWSRMCLALEGRVARVTVDDETVLLGGAHARVRLLREGAPRVVVSTSWRTIFDLADARGSLIDAILDERLSLIGPPEEVLAFHDGLMSYLLGGVRSPSFEPLFAELRSEYFAQETN
jgi:hypothetical protein